nr:hypothetical protein [Tanacetum cinerariifolium]
KELSKLLVSSKRELREVEEDLVVKSEEWSSFRNASKRSISPSGSRYDLGDRDEVGSSSTAKNASTSKKKSLSPDGVKLGGVS